MADLVTNRKVYKIFWKFIKPERDRILKEYEFSISGFGIADPAILRFNDDRSIYMWSPEEETLYLSTEVAALSDLSLPIDAPGLLQEAAWFWYEILYEIESHITPSLIEDDSHPF
jgi:hypothetical protein